MGSFIDELIEVNRRIPRRLTKVNQMLVTSRRKVVSPEFVGLDMIFCTSDSPENIYSQNYFFQLGRGEHRGTRKVNRYQANLALGYDFLGIEDDADISLMLEACERDGDANAYVLGPKISESGIVGVRTPVAYFRIPEEEHRALAINTDEPYIRALIDKLRLLRQGE